MNRQGKIRKGIATGILGFFVGTPLDSFGTALKPKPEWCKDENCIKFKEDCEYCITEQILAYLHSQGVVIRGETLGASHPHLSAYYTIEPLIKEEQDD